MRKEEDEVEEGRTQSGGKENREWRKGDEEERSSGDMVEKWWTEEEVQEGREEVEEEKIESITKKEKEQWG